MKKKVKKKYRLKYQNILVILLSIYLLFFVTYTLINKKISNIYIINNNYLTDQEIIEIAKIENYPSSLGNSCSKIKKRLLKDIYIKNVKVYKKNITEVYIEVEENRPLFYNSTTNKTILLNGTLVDKSFSEPFLINYVPDTIYKDFIKHISNISVDVINRISEIKYDPNEVDVERFLLTMNDDNYVYLTLNKFESINSYIDIIRKFEGKKGILYLDSGEYFKVVN